MFTERELKLLAILLGSDEWLSGKILSSMLNVRSRTLQSEVASINSILKKHSSFSRIASNNRLGYRLEGNREQIKKYVADMGFDSADDSYRSANSILTVLLYEDDYITLNDIADRTFLAPSSVSANLEKVRKMIDRARGAELIVHPRKGYRLKAQEHVKRMLVVNALDERISEVTRQYPEIEEGYEILDDVREVLMDVFLPVDYIIEGKAFDAFSRYCAFSITRQQSGHLMDEEIEDHEIEPVVRQIAASLSEELGCSFSEKELLSMDDRLKDLNVLGISKKDYPLMEEKIRRFSDLVKEETGLSIELENSYLKRLSEHLYRMDRRLDVGNYLRTQDPEAIEKQYPVALHLVRTILRRVFGKKLPGNEERLVVPYIASFINDSHIKVKVDIVSDLPVGEVYRFRSRLYETYGNYIDRIRIFPVYLYEKRFANRDEDPVYFTTEEKLVFRYDELIYVDLYEEIYQSDMIVKTIMRKSDELKKKRFLGFAERFEDEVCEYEVDGCGIDDILEELAGSSSSENRSCCVIDDFCLLVISHGGKDHVQKKVILSEALIYDNRSIDQILYFNIGCAEDADLFSQYIRETINRRI